MSHTHSTMNQRDIAAENIFQNSDAFLNHCSQSSLHCHQALDALAARLRHRDSRPGARVFLQELMDQHMHRLERHEAPERKFMEFRKLNVEFGRHRSTLRLLQLPSTFLPEAWSFTFLEGLAKSGIETFEDKCIVELGCGIGWIALTLALLGRPRTVYGLDINPKAVVCSRINKHINLTNGHAAGDCDRHHIPGLDGVRFFRSDLLNCFMGTPSRFDVIVGCIPQMLAPSTIIPHEPSKEQDDQLLFALSNYYRRQGLPEDRYGLGLVARALDHAQTLLAPQGQLILNIGARPGQKAIDGVFHARGYATEILFRRRIPQAHDTDIDSLVNIEKGTGHRFEFFHDLTTADPISAKEASAMIDDGREVYHDLLVYRARRLSKGPARQR